MLGQSIRARVVVGYAKRQPNGQSETHVNPTTGHTITVQAGLGFSLPGYWPQEQKESRFPIQQTGLVCPSCSVLADVETLAPEFRERHPTDLEWGKRARERRLTAQGRHASKHALRSNRWRSRR